MYLQDTVNNIDGINMEIQKMIFEKFAMLTDAFSSTPSSETLRLMEEM